MQHLVRLSRALPKRSGADHTFNIVPDRTEALKLGKEMALYHNGEIHVYELVKIMKPTTHVEVSDPPADARPRERHEGGVTLEEKQALCGNE